MLFIRFRSIPIACSPTALEFASPADSTCILFFLAETKSIFSKPAPTLAMNFSLLADLIISLSIIILLLIIIPT